MEQFDQEKLYKCIGRNIKEIRKIKQLKTSDLANDLCIAEGSLRNIESGAPLSVPVFVGVSKILNIRTDDLLMGYRIASTESNVDSVMLQLFVDVYTNSTDEDRKVIFEILKAFNRKNTSKT